MKTILAFLSLGLSAALASTVRAADISPAETRAIAEEGFIYGLPMVMNYAVMYQYAVDRGSGQFKAPFNQIYNEARVFTYQDTTIITPNSDTPYSLLWADLRAEPIVLSVPEVDKSRYYSVMLCDGNTYNYGYIGSRATGSEAGDYLVAGRLERRSSKWHQESISVQYPVLAADLSHPALQPRGHAECDQGSGRLQSPAALQVSEPTCTPGCPGRKLSGDQ
jgi:uncharacterized protein DUF1254